MSELGRSRAGSKQSGGPAPAKLPGGGGRILRVGSLGPRRWAPLLSALVVGLISFGSAEHSWSQHQLDPALQRLQETVRQVIERRQESVVAVARVRQPAGRRAENGVPLLPGLTPGPGVLLDPDLLDRPLRGQAVLPTDPSFVPNEFGAGVVVGAEGLILTTYHVVGDPRRADYFVWSTGRPFRATVLAADPWYDLAVLKIERAGGPIGSEERGESAADRWRPLEFGNGAAARQGDFVVALGNPQGTARDGRPSSSWGIIANRLRSAPQIPSTTAEPQSQDTLHHYGTLLQTSAELGPGFSGGALLDLEGRMLGLITTYTGGSQFDEAAGLVIPVDDHFQRVVKQLKEGRKPEYGFLGVATEPLSLAERQAGRLGAVVSRVLPATPAAEAGLRVGDLIRELDSSPVVNDDDLIRQVSSRAPESEVRLTVFRGDWKANRHRVLEADVILSKKGIQSLRPTIGTEPASAWRGVRVEYRTAVPDFQGVDSPDGVVAVAVDEDSAAWRAGIRPGVLISRVANREVRSPREFSEQVAERTGPVVLTIVRGSERVDRTVSP